MSMNPAVKELWTTALTSGKYKRGVGNLKEANEVGTVKHCCLGVLCEIATVVGITNETEVPLRSCNCPKHKDLPAVKKSHFSPDDVDFGYPPPKVLEWAGLTMDEVRTLASLNDGGMAFGEIAEHISNAL